MTTAKQALQAHRAAWAIRAKQLKAMDRVQNEGGEGYSQYEAESEKNFYAEQPLIAAAFAEEWTLEVFTARRAAWNAEVVKCKTHRAVSDLAQRLGYGLSDLKKAKDILVIDK